MESDDMAVDVLCVAGDRHGGTAASILEMASAQEGFRVASRTGAYSVS